MVERQGNIYIDSSYAGGLFFQVSIRIFYQRLGDGIKMIYLYITNLQYSRNLSVSPFSYTVDSQSTNPVWLLDFLCNNEIISLAIACGVLPVTSNSTTRLLPNVF